MKIDERTYTAFPEEITGEYYPKKRDWTVTITTIVVVGLIIVAVEYLFGDDITRWMMG